MEANNILFRASSIGKIMTDPRSKSETLSETCKTYLLERYIQEKYGRSKEITSKFLEKGIQCEDDSITLLSLVSRKFYEKNETNLKNDFVSGTPDLFTGESINNADLIIDIKTSWDIFTFVKSSHDAIDKGYYWQLQAYMWLTGARKAKLVYCLVNTPDALIEAEKRSFMYKSGSASPEAFDEIENNAKYDDIPNDERVHVIEVEYNEADIFRLQNRIIDCREYLETL